LNINDKLEESIKQIKLREHTDIRKKKYLIKYFIIELLHSFV